MGGKFWTNFNRRIAADCGSRDTIIAMSIPAGGGTKKAATGLAARFLVLLLAAAGLGSLFHGFAFDDPFITYRVAQNLAEGQGWVYNPGERVNAVTSPLHTLVLAGLHRTTGLAFPLLGAVVSLAGLAVASLALVRLLEREGHGPGALLAGALVLINPFLLQSLGMETGLLLALIMLAILAYAGERWVLCAVLFALASLTRLDALVLAGLVLLHFIFTRKQAPPLRALLVFMVLVLPWFVFSLLYFGEALPHTLAVKTAQSQAGEHWGGPWMFVKTTGAVLLNFFGRTPDLTAFLVVVLAGLGLFRSVKKKPRGAALILLWAALHLVAYGLVLRPPPYTWYLAPLFVALCLLLGLGAIELAELIARNRRVHALTLIVAIGGLMVWAVALGLKIPLLAALVNPVHLGHALGYFALLAAGLLLGFRRFRSRAWSRALVALLLVVAAFVPRHLVGWQQMMDSPTTQYLHYRAAAEWIQKHRPEAGSVGAHEIGALGFFLGDLPIIDQCGIPTPEAAQALARGDMTWWVRKYRPALLVLHPAVAWWHEMEGPLREAAWFSASYRLAVVLLRPDGSGEVQAIAPEFFNEAERTGEAFEKHAVEIWELYAPEKIPRP